MSNSPHYCDVCREKMPRRTSGRCAECVKKHGEYEPGKVYIPTLPVNGPVGDSGWKHDNTYHGPRPFDV